MVGPFWTMNFIKIPCADHWYFNYVYNKNAAIFSKNIKLQLYKKTSWSQIIQPFANTIYNISLYVSVFVCILVIKCEDFSKT